MDWSKGKDVRWLCIISNYTAQNNWKVTWKFFRYCTTERKQPKTMLLNFNSAINQNITDTDYWQNWFEQHAFSLTSTLPIIAKVRTPEIRRNTVSNVCVRHLPGCTRCIFASWIESESSESSGVLPATPGQETGTAGWGQLAGCDCVEVAGPARPTGAPLDWGPVSKLASPCGSLVAAGESQWVVMTYKGLYTCEFPNQMPLKPN